MGFIATNKAPAEKTAQEAFFFLIKGQEIFVRADRNRYFIPNETELSFADLDVGKSHLMGLWNGQLCYALEVSEDVSFSPPITPISLRDAFTQFSSSCIRAISLATQILTWDRNHRFCGHCGEPTTELAEERAKVCKHCGLIQYPRLSPSIIVSVVKNEHILLARSDRFPQGMYSVLAGFVEPGETLEECIEREVLEEVGIEVGNIRYFGSQNWPFPHSLMIGFTADYVRGEISIDNREIVDAKWFTAQDLPRLPGNYSIARELIDHFCMSTFPAHSNRQ